MNTIRHDVSNYAIYDSQDNLICKLDKMRSDTIIHNKDISFIILRHATDIDELLTQSLIYNGRYKLVREYNWYEISGATNSKKENETIIYNNVEFRQLREECDCTEFAEYVLVFAFKRGVQ